jgi:hypothetical protein
MARPRVPLIKAEVTGCTTRNPKRFKDRKEPSSQGPLGEAPKWFKTQSQLGAWNTFRDELPWLDRSHRSLIEIAATIRARVMNGDDIGMKALNLLRQCLGQMGATPADSSKVKMPAEKVDDPADKYFR